VYDATQSAQVPSATRPGLAGGFAADGASSLARRAGTFNKSDLVIQSLFAHCLTEWTISTTLKEDPDGFAAINHR